MIQSVRDWLPTTALGDDRVRDAISSAIKAWSARWFSGRGYSYHQSLVNGRAGSTRANADWREFGCVAVAWSDADFQSLARKALDAPKSATLSADADINLLARFAEEIARDLGDAVGQSLSMKPGHDGRVAMSNPTLHGSGLDICLDDGGFGPKLRLFIAVEHLVSYRKAIIGSRRAALARTAKFADAVAEANVSFTAALGDVRISAADLTALAIGDVLVLDRDLSESIALRTSRSGVHFLEASVSQANQRILLTAAG